MITYLTVNNAKGGAQVKISGLQKLTLLDFPGKTACTVFLGGCNFRCPFCHNASLVLGSDGSENIPEEEFLAFLESRRNRLDGVAVTGGEPLISDNAEALIKKIKALGFAVKLDTNGTYSERLSRLIENGLVDYVAMDIKNSPHKYAKTIGLSSAPLGKIEESIHLLMNGKVGYEFRTTLVKGFHTQADIETIGKWITGAERWYLQAFKDSGELIREGLEGFSREEYLSFLDTARRFVPNAQLRGL